jgi:hypothetical protein
VSGPRALALVARATGTERIDPYNIADAAVEAAWWTLVDWAGDGELRIWRIGPGYKPQLLPPEYWVRQRLLGDLYPWTDLSRYEVSRTDLERLLKKLTLPESADAQAVQSHQTEGAPAAGVPKAKAASAPATKKRRKSPQSDAAKDALKAVYPEGVLEQPVKTTTDQVNQWLKSKKRKRVSEDVVGRVLKEGEEC